MIITDFNRDIANVYNRVGFADDGGLTPITFLHIQQECGQSCEWMETMETMSGTSDCPELEIVEDFGNIELVD